MPSPDELARLAAAANHIRPEWPGDEILRYLTKYHANRAYRDLAVALVYIATDPTTRTPGRLGEAGPWWRLTEEQTRTPVGRRIPCPVHPDQPAGRCQPCKDQRATPEQIREARELAARLVQDQLTKETH